MRLPLIPTAMVALGVPLLVSLGVWQLERRAQKAGAIAAFMAPEAGQFQCAPLSGPVEQRGGRSGAGQTGYSHFATCNLGTERIRTDLGWTRRPQAIDLPAGATRLDGLLYRMPNGSRLLIATNPPAPLVGSALPRGEDIPDNHLVYALQWFAFAVMLPVIYGIWLRRWRRERRG